jgi:transposase-like protein
MGTSPDTVMTDKLRRRSGPRRKDSVAEKRWTVEETRQPGASAPEVAQRHGVNASVCSRSAPSEVALSGRIRHTERSV